MARFAGVDIPNNKQVGISLTYIYGIGRSTAKKILADAGVDETIRVKDLTEAQENAIRQQILDFYWDLRNDNKYCIPSCGTMQQIFNRGDWFKFQEKILGALLDLQKNQDAF